METGNRSGNTLDAGVRPPVEFYAQVDEVAERSSNSVASNGGATEKGGFI